MYEAFIGALRTIVNPFFVDQVKESYNTDRYIYHLGMVNWNVCVK